MSKINIVIPMAGLGTRFSKAGYERPKPLIEIFNKTMIERVLDNLSLPNAHFILILRKEHRAEFPETFKEIQSKYPVDFIEIDQVTEGAACTVLHSAFLINNETPLLIANSDQIVEMNLKSFVEDAQNRNLNGSILTFQDDHPKWSYAQTDKDGYLTLLREKEVISDQATVGIYYFSSGKDFVSAASKMIAHNDRVNNEFYTAPTYNYLVDQSQKIGIFEIQKEQMFGTGTPEDLDIYIDHLKDRGVHHEASITQ